MYCICVLCRICALFAVTIDENTSFSSEPHCESWEATPRSRIGAGDGKKRRSFAAAMPFCTESIFNARHDADETCFDDDADHYPSYAAAKSVGEGFAKKRAASLISSIRRPGNAPSKLPVEFTLEDTD
ncbi:hypothetical protein ALC56_14211 [Trachymyrmex septentrionalis]|uniref:Uncharacterized protein n=1 Tax=Trachymyrmex septentrionalis TaxID=34720 RepID=A0A195ESV2_9HYME|nr:hypothetical protein ALC56_14211 [Trachymyrmex septentrionalis]